MDKKLRTATITQFNFIIKSFVDEALDLQGHLHHHSEFNESGKPVSEIRYNSSGDFEEEVRYEYDEKGELIHEYYYLEADQLAEQKIYHRDDKGRITHAEKIYQDGSVDTYTYEYDGANHLVRLTTTNDEGEVEQVETFTWDGEQIVTHETVDSGGEPVAFNEVHPETQGETRLTRNDAGQVIREEEVDETGSVYMTIDRNYDDDGRPIEVEVHFDGRGRALSRHYFLKYEYTFFE